MRGVTKVFPGVVANDDVTIAFHAGEVHCILGENGAGKSTLVNILSGMYRPDAGLVLVDGDEVDIGSPRAALDHGIGTVYQHSTLIPVFTVLENLMVGRGRGRAVRCAWIPRRPAAPWSGRRPTWACEIDPDALAGGLSLGQQQHVEIVKALGSGSRVLILDEPTSMLTPQGIAELEKVLLRLKAQGLAIVFITHKLREALAVGDRVTILRRGRVVGELGPDVVHGRPRDELQAEIVGLMFGTEAATLADVAEVRAEVGTRRAAREISEHVSLELVDVCVEAGRGEVGIVDVSLRVHSGEILGIAGVDGNGQRELAEAIAGQRRVHTGDILLDGTSIRHAGVSKRQRLGLRYVTDDRLGEGTVSSLSVAQNLVLKRIGEAPFWRRGRIQEDAIAEYAEELVDAVRHHDPRCGRSVRRRCRAGTCRNWSWPASCRSSRAWWSSTSPRTGSTSRPRVRCGSASGGWLRTKGWRRC